MTLCLTSHPLSGEAAKEVTYEGWEGARALDRASPDLSRAEHPRDQTAMEPETRDEPEAGDEQSCTVYGLYDQDLTHKTILVGDSGVGKTSLLVQFDQGKFIPGSFSATVGIGFTNKVVTVGDVKVKLQIWDTAGQERFRSVTHAYYRDAHALLLLYDITNKSSFDNIRAWLTEIHEYAQSDAVIMLLGNKEYGVIFMETSAKTGVNVDLAFMTAAKELIGRCLELPKEPKFQINDIVEQKPQKSGCCGFT
ncbi:ras-related protein Rab-37-like [Clarias magur]|uniref:Ras-related protein Rab-37-like n=1 Tax=Clarias magur TaxID=1594786 RepID=A0A8J4TZ89_CLAMG|nr:ras-related protein Rab-37-like [Clarias magur]